jgi:hypothetical protein
MEGGTQRAERKADVFPPFSASAVEGITLQRRSYSCITRNKTALPQLSPNIYIHISVSDLYIYSTIDLSILLQPTRQTNRGNI